MRMLRSLLVSLCLTTTCFAGDKIRKDQPRAVEGLHQQLLDLTDRHQKERRDGFAKVTTKAELEALQKSLREKFLRLIGGLPESKGIPPAKILGTIEAEDYVIEKLVFESYPGYFVNGS